MVRRFRFRDLPMGQEFVFEREPPQTIYRKTEEEMCLACDGTRQESDVDPGQIVYWLTDLNHGKHNLPPNYVLGMR